MSQKEREALAKLVVTFYKNQKNICKKSTISHFAKAGVPRSTLYRILKNILNMEKQLSFQNPVDQRRCPLNK